MAKSAKKSETKTDGHPFERTTTYMAPPEALIVIGIDEEDDKSLLNDERVQFPLDEDMIDTIRRHGVKKPILCRKNPATGKYEVVDGRQRTLNAREANRRMVADGVEPIKVPVRLEKGSDDLMFELQIILNHHTESTPLMKARAMEKHFNLYGSKAEACRVNRISEATFDNWMALLQLDPEVHKAIDEGKISSNEALKFSKLPRPKQREAVQQYVASDAKKRRVVSRDPKKSTDKAKMPSKAALINIVNQNPEGVDPAFILGLKFALGMVQASDVPGLEEVKGSKK